MKTSIQNWKAAFQHKSFSILLLLMLCLFFVLVLVYPVFFNFIEQRNGILLQDPILAFLVPRDNSLAIFSLLWISVAMQAWLLKAQPYATLSFIMSYFIINLTRIATILIVPLNPPPHLIPLQDPLSNYFYGTHFITKDLFYSGHTALVFLIAFTNSNKWLKFIFIICATAIAFMVLSNHVHYTIDVLAAPIFVAFSVFLTKKIMLKIGLP